jgi:hypothetical protein
MQIIKIKITKIKISVNNVCMQGGDEEGGGSDIGALLGNLGPLIGGLSGVSYLYINIYKIFNPFCSVT